MKNNTLKFIFLITTVIFLWLIFNKVFVILGILINDNNNIWNVNIFLHFILLAVTAFIIQILFSLFLKIICFYCKLIKSKDMIIFSIKFSIILISISTITVIILLILIYKLKILGIENIMEYIIVSNILVYIFIYGMNMVIIEFEIIYYTLNLFSKNKIFGSVNNISQN